MQYEARTPAEYLENLENDWRKEKLLAVRDFILHGNHEIDEDIEYKMLSYSYGGKNIFHLNAQKAYVSLYVGNLDKVKNATEMLKEFNLGKGCIRIKKKVDLSKTGLKDFIKETIKVWKTGGNTDC